MQDAAVNLGVDGVRRPPGRTVLPRRTRGVSAVAFYVLIVRLAA